MKHTFVVILGICLLSLGSVFAQQLSWQQVCPLPQGNILNGVWVSGADTVLTCGGGGTILSSYNGGATWHVDRAVLADTDLFYVIKFVTKDIGWAAGDDGFVFKTTDGGYTWRNTNLPFDNSILALDFISTTTGWVVGMEGKIFRTADGGDTWTSQQSGTTSDLFDVKFVSAQSGFCAGAKGVILHTSDGGATWTKQNGNTSAALFSCSFVSPLVGWISGSLGLILHTTNGGTTWTTQTSPYQTSLYSIKFLNASLGWTCGSIGTILKTTDGGANWWSTLETLSDDLFGISFTTATTGWAVGDLGRILKSTDGGDSWQLQSTGTTTDLISTSYATQTDGMGVGDIGMIARTTDGGMSWTQQNPNTDQPFWAVANPASLTGVIAADSGLIFNTSDGGATWHRWDTHTELSMYGVSFLNSRYGWVVGDAGSIFKTVNGGILWADQSVNLDVALVGVKFKDVDTGFATADDGSMLRTVHGGSLWTPISTGVDVELYALEYTSDGAVWAVGDGSTIIRSYDAGVTWEDISTDAGVSYYSIAFLTPRIGWVVGDDGELDMTTDGGESWTKQVVPTTNTLYAIQIVSTANGALIVASGWGNTVLTAAYGTLQTRQWTGAADTLWTNANNWNPAGMPGNLDQVLIPGGATQPVLNLSVQQVNLGSLEVAAGAALKVRGTVGKIFTENGLKVAGTLQFSPGSRTEIGSGGDLLLQPTARILYGNPIFTCTGKGNIAGSMPQLFLDATAEMTSAGNIAVSRSMNLLSWLSMRKTDTVTIRNTLAGALSGLGVINGGAVKRSIELHSTEPYRFESPMTTVQFLGTGNYPDSVLILSQPGVKPADMPDSVFAYRTYSIATWGGPTAPVNLSLRFDENETLLSSSDMALFRDSSGYLLNMGSTNSFDDPYFGVELDSTVLYPTWYLGESSFIPQAQFQFLSDLTVSNAGNQSATLVWGAQPGASSGLDPVFGEAALGPIPPPGTFDARWRLDGPTTSTTDIRHLLIDNVTTNVYRCEFQPGVSGYPVTFRWDSTTLPLGDIFLRDAETAGGRFNINLKLQSSYVLADSTTKAVEIVHRKPRIFSYATGWNLISYPVTMTTSNLRLYNYPASTSLAFYYDDGYRLEEHLQNGKGYWLKFPRPVKNGVEGTALTTVPVAITTGWNMIGSLSENIPIANAVPGSPNLLASPVKYFAYVNGGYTVVDSLRAGYGCWVKGTGAGILTLSSTVKRSVRLEPAASTLAGYNTAVFTDRNGSTQTLYFGSAKEGADISFEMPPPPPAGAFDVRFTSQQMLEALPQSSRTVTLPVTIHTTAFPVTVVIHFAQPQVRSVSLVDPTSGKALGSCAAGKARPIVLSSVKGGTLSLVVSKTSGDVPAVFALAQNYPNPFNPATTLQFSLPEKSLVTLTVYNILGQEVMRLLDRQEFPEGIHQTIFNGSNLASGVYFCRLNVNATGNNQMLYTGTRKVMMVK